MNDTHWHAWHQYFTRQAQRPMPVVTAPELTPHQRTRLATSLAVFQVGEAGEGRIARDIDHVSLTGIDSDYRASLKLFVTEEGRHARILKTCVMALQGALLTREWTEGAFVRVRRLFGVRFKLLVLTVAEVMGIAFYDLVARALPTGPMRQALEQVCADEAAHLQFHAQFFRAQQGTVAHRLLALAWPVVCTAAALLVLREHGETLETLGVPRAVFAARLTALRQLVTQLAFAPRQLERSTENTAVSAAAALP